MKTHKAMTVSPNIIKTMNQELRDWWNMKNESAVYVFVGKNKRNYTSWKT
jgi:hypothetical protein